MKKHSIAVLLSVFLLTACGKQPNKETISEQQSAEQQMALAKTEFSKKNYGKTIEITVKITQTDPTYFNAYYLEAQAQTLAGNIREALLSLEMALKNGFKDFKSLMEDPYLNKVKTTPEFELLMQRYNPDHSAKTTINEKEIRAGDTSIKEESGQKVIKAGDIEIRIPKD